MPNKQQQIDGDVVITGNLEVVGALNDMDMGEVLAAGQVTDSNSIVIKANISDMWSDNKITPVEKLTVKREWENIVAEYAEVLTRATTWGVGAGFTNYDAFVAAYAALDAYLNTSPDVLGDLTVTTDITGQDMRDVFVAYWDTKQKLLDELGDLTVMIGPSDTNLVGYWPLNDSPDDFSGNGNHGVLTAGAGGYEQAVVGKGYHFDGVSERILLPTSIGVLSAWSLCAWVYLDTLSPADSDSAIIELRQSSDNHRTALRFADGAGKLEFYFSGASFKTTTANSVAVVKTWYFVAGTYDGTTFKLYINGILQDDVEGSVGETLTPDENMIAARANLPTSNNFDGIADELRIYNKDLSQAEVTFLYRNPSGVQMTAPVPKDPGKEDLVLYMPLDEIEGTRVVDASGNGNDGTLTPGSGAWEDGKVGNAYHFDGATSRVALPDSIGTMSTCSISALINLDTLAPASAVNKVVELRDGDSSHRVLIYVTTDANDRLNALWLDDGVSIAIASDGFLAADTWYHVVITYDSSGTGRMYIDGILQSTITTDAGFSITPDQNMIGADTGGANSFWDGLIDELRVYSKALSPEEVLYLYRNPGGSPKGLVTRNDVAVGELNAKHLWYGGYHSLITNTEIFDSDEDGELFPLDFTCLSDLGRYAVEKRVHYEPAILRDEDETEYHNPRAKRWDGLEDDPRTDTIGVYQATENDIADPEDLTTANWTSSGTLAATLSDYSFDGHRFTKLVSSTNGADRRQTFIFSGSDGVKAVRIELRKGTAETDSQVIIYDGTAASTRAQLIINWATESATAGVGTLVDEYWVSSDIVILSVITLAITVASSNRIIVRPSNAGTGTMYATACQGEDSVYPTPYTPSSRPAGTLQYRKTLQDEGAIECWVRPRFTYDHGTSHVVWSFYKDATHYFALYYNETGNSFTLQYYWGSNIRTLSQPTAYTSNASLWDNIHVKAVWDFSAGTGKLIINGATVDSSWSAAPDAYDGTGHDFFVGEFGNGALLFDGEITDLAIHNTEDDTSTHYTADAPWLGAYVVPNYDQTVSISRKQIKLIRAELAMVDKKSRTVDVGSQGILARDRAGAIIHNIPEAPILSGMNYGGHLIWVERVATIATLSVGATDVNTYNSFAGTKTNVDITAHLPSDLGEIQGLYAELEIQTLMYGDATQGKGDYSTTFTENTTSFATIYDATPSYSQTMHLIISRDPTKFYVTKASAQVGSTTIQIPVFRVGSSYYITWIFAAEFGRMTANNRQYSSSATLNLIGVYI